MEGEPLAGRVPRLVLVHWDEEEATAWSQELMETGWDVSVECQEPSLAYRHIRELQPEVVVVCLEQKGDWGFRAAEAVRSTRWGREVPFVFVGGDDDDALMTLREAFPESSYVEYEELPAALEGYRHAHDR